MGNITYVSRGSSSVLSTKGWEENRSHAGEPLSFAGYYLLYTT